MGYQKAKREKLKALVAMMGASGHGKTFSSLVLAKGMIMGEYPELDPKSDEFWDKIGVIDTEHNRSKIYADMVKHDIYIGSFLHSNMEPPFTAEKYIKSIREAKEAGIEILIIDSTTHLWKDLLAEQSELGGRYQDWKEPTKKYEAFIQEFTQAGIHIIATMRAKQEYALEKNEVDKLEVVKLGTKPVQRDDFEFEFLTAFMFDKNHMAETTKDNTPLFEPLGKFKITEQHGEDLVKWLAKGEDVMAQREQQRLEFIDMISQLVLDDETETIQKLVQGYEAKVGSIDKFTLKQADFVYQKANEAYKALQEKKKEDTTNNQEQGA